jgi:hypothetical protein
MRLRLAHIFFFFGDDDDDDDDDFVDDGSLLTTLLPSIDLILTDDEDENDCKQDPSLLVKAVCMKDNHDEMNHVTSAVPATSRSV